MTNQDQIMVSKEEYLNALLIVEKYHAQIKNEALYKSNKLVDIGLKRGNLITYIGGSQSKYLKENNQYRLTCAPFRDRVCIINDNGKRMNCSQEYFTSIRSK